MRASSAPNGIAYDRVRKLLYVSDAVVPADRILVFNVDPAVFENGATAVTVLGASDESAGAARVFGGGKGYPGQFTVRDTRRYRPHETYAGMPVVSVPGAPS